MDLGKTKIDHQIDYIIEKLYSQFKTDLEKCKGFVDPHTRQKISKFAYRIYSNCSDGKDKPSQTKIPHSRIIQEALGINGNTIEWDKGWLFNIESSSVYSKLYGQYLVYKHGESKLIRAGDFIINDRATTKKNETTVDIKIKTFQKDKSDEWFWVRGKYFLSFHNIVRYYFSLNSQNYNEVLAFIKAFREALNDKLIPFEMKFETVLTDRFDNLVLYIQQQHYYIVFHIINELYYQFKPQNLFRNQCPLFTKELLAGISFAEDPHVMGQSFGTNRCELITDAFIAYFQDEQAGILLNDYVKTHIKNETTSDSLRDKFDIEDLFRCPNSKFPYDFTVFEEIPQPKEVFIEPLKKQLTLAYHLGKIICRLGLIIRENNQTKCYWISTEKDEMEDNCVECKFLDDTFDNGKLGIAYLFARLCRVFKNEAIMLKICRLILDEYRHSKRSERVEEIEAILSESESNPKEMLMIKETIIHLADGYNEITQKMYDNDSEPNAFRAVLGNEVSNRFMKNTESTYMAAKIEAFDLVPKEIIQSSVSAKNAIKPFFEGEKRKELYKIMENIEDIIDNISEFDSPTLENINEFRPAIADKSLSYYALALLEIIDEES